MSPGTRDEERGPAKVVTAAAKMKCAKCGGGMEEGFLFEASPRPNRTMGWGSGKPQPVGVFRGVLAKGRKQRKVSAFRCAKCGYLESYAL